MTAKVKNRKTTPRKLIAEMEEPRIESLTQKIIIEEFEIELNEEEMKEELMEELDVLPIIERRRKKMKLLQNWIQRLGQNLFNYIAPTTLKYLLYLLFFLAILISFKSFITQTFSNLIPNSLNFIPSLPSLSAISSPIIGLYCTSIGIGCGESKTISEARLGFISQQTRIQTEIALDIFDSLLAISPSKDSSSLNHVALWELSIAVGTASNLEEKRFLSSQLMDLGDLTREVRDSSISLNSLGINAFTWIYHGFESLQMVISSQTSLLNEEILNQKLENLFSRINNDLEKILIRLDLIIPKADRASNLGGRILEELSGQTFRTQKVMEEEDFLIKAKHKIGLTGFKEKQLRRDFDLSTKSVESVRELRDGLERARSDLKQYQDNVGFFKAGLVGFHIGNQGLNAREELSALSEIMNRFKATLSIAKGGSISSKRSKLLEIDSSR